MKKYIANVFRSNSDYIVHILYKKYDNRTFNKTENIIKHVNNYSNDVTNSDNIKNNVKKTYYSFNDDITLNKTSTDYSNDTYNITKNTYLFDITDNQYVTQNT